MTVMTDTGSIRTVRVSDLPVWEQARRDRTLLSVVFELTERCNNSCNHCYINRSVADETSRQNELGFDRIMSLADEAVSMGALWVLLSGGEPLLRDDFSEIYTCLKKKGLLVSVFTNGSLVTGEHVRLFRKYPPRDIDVTVYGASAECHERVTGRKTFKATMAGIDLLLENGLPVTLKSTIMRSNVDEIEEIADFCRERTRKPFRFDQALHLRLDGDPARNRMIMRERLAPEEVVEIERKMFSNGGPMARACADGDAVQATAGNPEKIFRCRAGSNSCCISADGHLKLCSSLGHEATVCDLRQGSLRQAWEEFVPTVMQMRSAEPYFLATCGSCSLHPVCSWCPACAYQEAGKLDGHLPYFCGVAHARQEMFTHE